MITSPTIVAGLLCASAVSTAAAQLAPPPPICFDAPAGASKEVETCFDDACLVFQAQYLACQTFTCRQIARNNYILAISSCLPALVSTTPINRSSWITLSYAGGEWSYSFDGSSPPQAITYRY